MSSRADRQPRAYGPIQTEPLQRGRGEDAVDLHVRRWDGWDDIAFDPVIEAVVTRFAHIARYLDRTTQKAVRTVGLEKHDYFTLHALLIRETPGHATAGELAAATGVSNAAMTGRIDRLVGLGLARRLPSEDDRRVVHVQVTDAGFQRWKRAVALRGAAEEALLEGLSVSERDRLSRLLRKVLLTAERAS